MTTPLTVGIHHLGLAVPDLEEAERFFVAGLGWSVAGRRPDYPAAFVSDGAIVLTLWRVAHPASAVAFDRRANVGLHHLALAVADKGALMTVFDRVCRYPGVEIEFAPEPSRPGAPGLHFICAMPGGIRVEFATLHS